MLFLKILFKDWYHLFRSRESRAFLGLALRHGDAARYSPRRVRFERFRFRVPDALSFLWQCKEIFVEEAYHFQTTSPQPLIFDCGANVGTSCVYFKRRHPGARIRAFEADPHIATYLTENLAQNGIQGVEVIAKAVWVHNEGVDIGQEGADGASVRGTGAKVRVPSVRLRDWLAAVGGDERIELLKMDIEGAETEVLKDCRHALARVQHLFLEYHAYLGQPQDLDEILAILRQNGFRYFIRDAQDRPRPLSNRVYRPDGTMDLQLNIFAWKE